MNPPTKTLSKIKSLSNFMGSALSRVEMKGVIGGGCAVVHWSGGSKGQGTRNQSPATFSKSEAKSIASQNGAGYGWCCASCT